MKLHGYISLVLLIISCNNQAGQTHGKNENEIIKEFYTSQTSREDFSKYRSAILINEGGSCLNCNNAFALSHANEIEDDSILFIVSSCGSRIDISPYITQERSNIIWDSMSVFEELLPLETCKVVELKNK